MNIYVASSWRNKYQPLVVALLRQAGHEVYDFRNPTEGDNGFHWEQIDPDWENWTPEQYRDALNHPIANEGFKKDHDAMDQADVCVLVLPSGRSSHLEAGEFAAVGDLFIFIPEPVEPELTYKGGTICLTPDELLQALGRWKALAETMEP